MDALPAGQAARESRLYALDSDIALSRTRVEAMQMERAEGYPLHLSEDDITSMADLGFHSEKSGQASRADTVHIYLLFSKIDKHKPVDDADIDSLIAILRQPSKTPSEARLTIMGLFHRLPDASHAQQQKIRAAVTPFLTSADRWERKDAEAVMKKFGGGAPAAPPARKAQATPAAPYQITQQTAQTGVSSMTPRIALKPMLLKMAAFTALAAGLTMPAAQAAPPAPAPKPAVPALAVVGAHWNTIVLQHATLGAVRTFTGWDRGRALPEGVDRVYFLESNHSILAHATQAGLAHIRGAIKAIETAPQPVQLCVTFAAITEAELNALTPRFYEVPLDGQGAMVKSLRVFSQGTNVSALAAFLAAPTNREAVVVAPVVTTDTDVAATIDIGGAPLMPGSRSVPLVVTPRIDNRGFLTLQMVVPSLLSAVADGNAPPPIQVLRPVSSGTPVVLIDSLPPAAGGGNRYLLVCVTPTEVTGPDPAR